MAKSTCTRRAALNFFTTSVLIVFLFISICALGIALGYDWARVDVVQSYGCTCTCARAPCVSTCCAVRESVYLGMFGVVMVAKAANETVFQSVAYETFELNNSVISIKALRVVVTGSLASGVMSLVCIFFAVASLLCTDAKSGLHKTLVSAIYIFCLLASIFSATALATFLDFYTWKLRDGMTLLPDHYLNVFTVGISTVQYFSKSSLDWAFYLHAAGASCSIITFVLACAIVPAPFQAPAPPPSKPASPSHLTLVTSLVYDKEKGRWLKREGVKEREQQLAMETVKEGMNANPHKSEKPATETLNASLY